MFEGVPWWLFPLTLLVVGFVYARSQRRVRGIQRQATEAYETALVTSVGEPVVAHVAGGAPGEMAKVWGDLAGRKGAQIVLGQVASGADGLIEDANHGVGRFWALVLTESDNVAVVRLHRRDDGTFAAGEAYGLPRDEASITFTTGRLMHHVRLADRAGTWGTQLNVARFPRKDVDGPLALLTADG